MHRLVRLLVLETDHARFRWRIARRARLEKEKSLGARAHTYTHVRVCAAHIVVTTSARTARVVAAAPRNSRVSPFMALICSRRCTRKCAKHSRRRIPKRTSRMKRQHCYKVTKQPSKITIVKMYITCGK